MFVQNNSCSRLHIQLNLLPVPKMNRPGSTRILSSRHTDDPSTCDNHIVGIVVNMCSRFPKQLPHHTGTSQR